MKKTLFVLALLLASMVTIQAQDITRTAWSTMVPGDQEMEMVLNFDDDGECYVILTTEEFQELQAGMNMIIRSSLSVPGIYNQDGRDITLSFNKKKAEFSYDIDLNVDDPIAIITAPNGCGKTTLLNLISFVISPAYDVFEKMCNRPISHDQPKCGIYC